MAIVSAHNSSYCTHSMGPPRSLVASAEKTHAKGNAEGDPCSTGSTTQQLREGEKKRRSQRLSPSQF